jgi:hypothetical protein
MFGNAQQNVRSVSPPRVLRASLSGPHAHALQVRLHAVKLLCVCAQQQPQQLHATRRRGTASTRADAAFSRLCSVACDPTPAVRVEARTHPSPPLEPCTCPLCSVACDPTPAVRVEARTHPPPPPGTLYLHIGFNNPVGNPAEIPVGIEIKEPIELG